MRLLIVSAAALAVASPVFAATDARSVTDLNLRAGPGVQYAITGVIPQGGNVSVEGCIAEVNWCKVAYDGESGWAYGAYLAARSGTAEITLQPAPARAEVVDVVVSDDSPQAAIAGGTIGALGAAALAAGPAGIAAAGILGAAAADAAADPEVETFVRANPVAPILLDGEVVVGAGVPETVTLYEVPQSELRYVWINGVPVLVEPAERRIVRILR